MLRLILIILFFLPSLTFADYELARSAKKIISRLNHEVKTTTLSNGLKVIIYPRPQAPVFSAVIGVRVGGVDEHPGSTGISHVLEHMAFKGTKTLGTKDYKKEVKLLKRLEKIMQASEAGTQTTPKQDQKIKKIRESLEKVWDSENTLENLYLKLGGVGLNATTSADLTNYLINLPNNAFDSWCEIESDRLAEPVWRQFYKERDVVKSERRMRVVDSPGGALYQKLIFNAYEVHPYRYPVIGFEDDLNRLTANQTDLFYQKHYVASNMAIALVGDLNPHEAFRKLEKCFSKLPNRPRPERTRLVEPKLTGQKEFVLDFDSEPHLVIAYHKPNYPNPADIKLNLWFEVLVGGASSPLYKSLVLQKKKASSVGYFEAPGAAFPNLYIIDAEPIGNYTNTDVLTEIDRSIASLLKRGITQKELDKVRRKFFADFVSSLQANGTLARNFVASELLFGDWNYFYEWLEYIYKLKPEEINQTAKKYIRKDNRVVGRLERK